MHKEFRDDFDDIKDRIAPQQKTNGRQDQSKPNQPSNRVKLIETSPILLFTSHRHTRSKDIRIGLGAHLIGTTNVYWFLMVCIV